MIKCDPIIATSMDGKSENIPEHFKTIYKTLFNSVDDSGKFEDVQTEVEETINLSHINEVNKVTPDLVREVASHIKDDKTDPTFTSPQTVLRMAEMFGSLSIAIKFS